MYKTTYHQDGTVTVWNVYAQTWQRIYAEEVTAELLATLNDSERKRIERIAAKAA